LIGTPKEKSANDCLQKLAYLTKFLQKELFRRARIKTSTVKEIMGEFRKAEKI
jgi:hypothetical protein